MASSYWSALRIPQGRFSPFNGAYLFLSDNHERCGASIRAAAHHRQRRDLDAGEEPRIFEERSVLDGEPASSCGAVQVNRVACHSDGGQLDSSGESPEDDLQPFSEVTARAKDCPSLFLEESRFYRHALHGIEDLTNVLQLLSEGIKLQFQAEDFSLPVKFRLIYGNQ